MTLNEAAGKPAERIIVEKDNGSTIRLKQFIPEDAETIYNLIAYDPEHLRQNEDDTADKYPNVEAVRESIVHPPDSNKYRFGIWDENVMVGSNGLTPKGNGRAELGSWIGKQYIGHEYAGKGRELLVDFAFNNLALDEVYCDIVTTNEPSHRSVEKSGFQFAGEFIDENGKHQWRYVLKRPNKRSER